MAERAGVSIGSLYQYFPNKEVLIFALAEQHAQDMKRLAQHHLEGINDDPAVEVLRRIIRGWRPQQWCNSPGTPTPA